ncbi:hypothetical protein CAPTEDRAFT_225245 [Capitella teleta]|uniref:Band 7 domain-containing protein n=1 Tax=Capitella teleta TaxID=283909 RepID=R7UFU8_CAPTE|nr:hypothetical protein CAPTEDRAFT_225245 [Capitella teleta]|eukprot:ELU05414.1 hypothetical protein CAPTEDRAFT_225245 [Capitella teleta]
MISARFIRSIPKASVLQRLVSQNAHQQKRQMSWLSDITQSDPRPMNTIIMFVPQQEAWIVERFGKFHRILEPGLNFLIPIIDKVKYVQSLKEITIEVPEQKAVTADNVTLTIDGVLYIKVLDAYKASYGVMDAEFAISKLAQTTMRSELGKIPLDTVFKERDLLNVAIVETINKAAAAWGLDCKRYEILDITLPPQVQLAMQMQVEAERKKRAAILDSEGHRQSNVNVAEGQKRARILNSEAYMTEAVNQANGEAEAILAQARAKTEAIALVAGALSQQNGHHAVSMRVAEQYIAAFGNLAKEGNTLLLPSNAGDVTSMVAQAMSIYQNLSDSAPKTPVTNSRNTC